MSASLTSPAEGGLGRPSLADALAALSIAGLLLPEAVAYSGLANLPPQAGVIALFAGLLCYGLLGSSRFAIVSATSSSAAVMAAAVASMNAPDVSTRIALATGLICLTGLVFFVAAAARLGAISAFIAKPVLRGVAFGLALTICIKQLPTVLAVNASGSNVLLLLFDLIKQVARWNLWSLGVGVTALSMLFGLARWQRIPAALLVIASGIAAYHFLPLQAAGVTRVGDIHLAMPSLTIPTLLKAQWLRLGEIAFALALILYAESYGSMRTLALKHGDTLIPNRDLLALGLSNLVSGLFQGMPVGAGFSGCSANEAAGAQSRWSAWISAAVLLVVVALFLPLIAYTPEPVLAAIVIHAVSHTLKPSALRPYFVWQRDRFLVLGAIVAVLLLGILDGLLLSIAASLLLTLRELAEANVSVLGRLNQGHDFVKLSDHPQAHAEPGMLIVRAEAPLFFGNVEPILNLVRTQLTQQTDTRVVILSLEESYDLDGTCVEALNDLALELQAKQRRLILARLKDRALAVLLRAQGSCLLARDMITLSVDDAVSLAQQNPS